MAAKGEIDNLLNITFVTNVHIYAAVTPPGILSNALI